MALPSEFNKGTVKGKILQFDGSPAQGTIIFEPRVRRLVVSDAQTVITPQKVTVELEGDGTFSVELPATNDQDVSPVNFTYRVTENLDNGLGSSYDLDVPVDAVVDISSILSGVPASGGAIIAKGDPGPAGPPGPPSTLQEAVADFASLPTEGNGIGDVRVTLDTGFAWGWSGTDWVEVGQFQGPPLGESGDLADRPAATSAPDGYHFFAADEGVAYVKVGAPGSGSWQPIADKVGAAAEAVSTLKRFVPGQGIALTPLGGNDVEIAALVPVVYKSGRGINISPGGDLNLVNLGTTTVSTAGAHSIAIPNGASAFYVEAVGGGGGGGGGRRGAAGSTRHGGGGGQAGGISTGLFAIPFGMLNLDVTVGAGGSAGAAATANNTDGGAGGAGGASLVGHPTYPTLRAAGGAGGSGGSTAGGFGGGATEVGGLAMLMLHGEGTLGGDGGGEADAWSIPLGYAIFSTRTGTVSGLDFKRMMKLNAIPFAGGGGGIKMANTLSAPAAASTGGATMRMPLYNAGAAGTPASKNAAPPTISGFPHLVENGFGFGGSGGAASLDSVAGNGSAGSPRGGGGGGGGASLNGFNSGAGGAGGVGFVRVVWI